MAHAFPEQWLRLVNAINRPSALLFSPPPFLLGYFVAPTPVRHASKGRDYQMAMEGDTGLTLVCLWEMCASFPSFLSGFFVSSPFPTTELLSHRAAHLFFRAAAAPAPLELVGLHDVVEAQHRALR
jgi:hypothetical protein